MIDDKAKIDIEYAMLQISIINLHGFIASDKFRDINEEQQGALLLKVEVDAKHLKYLENKHK